MWEQGCKFIQDSFLIARFQYKEFRYSEVRLYSAYVLNILLAGGVTLARSKAEN